MVLFSIGKIQNQPNYLSINKQTKKIQHIYTTEYYSVVKKEWNLVICGEIDESKGDHTKGKKPDTKKTSITCLYSQVQGKPGQFRETVSK